MMRDFYAVLGVEETDSFEKIKRAYKRLAKIEHPDKGGDSDRMKLINVAYEILGNVQSRREFDERWEIIQDDEDLFDDSQQPVAGALCTDKQPFSVSFRSNHARLSQLFHQNPLNRADTVPHLKEFSSDFYDLGELGCFDDIFSAIRALASAFPDDPSLNTFDEPLTPEFSIVILTEFLNAQYYGNDLWMIHDHINLAIENLRTLGAGIHRREIHLYEGILGIISMATEPTSEGSKELLKHIIKITDYAREAPDNTMMFLGPLLQSKVFRNFFDYALHLYWFSQDGELNIQCFDGFALTESALSDLREKLSTQSMKKGHLKKIVRYFRLLKRFEEKLREHAESAESYREKAYHILDWVPAFFHFMSSRGVVNNLLRAGLYFQKAASVEVDPALQMADEGLAFRMYAEARGIAERATPDVKLYAYAHMIRHLAQFHFDFPELNRIIASYQHHALVVADVFPFLQSEQANIKFELQENQSLLFARNFLHFLMDIVDGNNSNIVLEHKVVTVLYQAYEACLRGWYEDRPNPDLFEQLRVRLMHQLLYENQDTFAEMELNINFPSFLFRRDRDGWMTPTRSLHFPIDPRAEKFNSLDGVNIDERTGEITFSFRRLDRTYSSYDHLITRSDVKEMLSGNIDSALFSLEQVDPDMPLHPFNQIIYKPESLYRTQLFNAMLSADYLLKFLTIGSEVQGQYPYNVKPVDSVVKHLPEYLCQIIERFRDSQHTEAAHRFWFQAVEVPVAISGEDNPQLGSIKIAVNEVRMILKKHKLVLNEEGELVDAPEEADEGWKLYVLSPDRRRRLLNQRRPGCIEYPAMIFTANSDEVLCLEDEENRSAHQLVNFRHKILRLNLFEKNAYEQIIPNQDIANFLYHVTKEVSKQTGLSSHFSPEHIFAMEFTLHYNEFAQYFPELGRLRELSRITILIRLLNRLYEVNNNKLEHLNKLLNDRVFEKAITNIQNGIDEIHSKYDEEECANLRKLKQRLTDMFSQNRRIYQSISGQKTEAMRGLANELVSDRNRIERDIDSQISSSMSRMRRDYDSQLSQIPWNAYDARSNAESQIEGFLATARRDAERQKSDVLSSARSSQRNQLDQVFSEISSERGYYDARDALLNGRYNAMVSLLAEIEKRQMVSSIARSLHGISNVRVRTALTSNYLNIDTIASDLNNYELSLIKTQVQEAIGNLESQRRDVERERNEVRQKVRNLTQLKANYERLGVGQQPSKLSETRSSFWLPASVNREQSYRLVYGGVLIAPNIHVLEKSSLEHEFSIDRIEGAGQRQVGSVEITRSEDHAQPEAASSGGERNPPPSDPPPGSNGGFGGGSDREGDGHRGGDQQKSVHPFDLRPTHTIVKSRRAMNRLINDIKENGMQEPIKYVEMNGVKYVVDGHHRLMVARKLGLDNIPVEQITLPYKGYRTEEDLDYDYGY